LVRQPGIAVAPMWRISADAGSSARSAEATCVKSSSAAARTAAVSG
jgi:hypothetical protein